MSFFLIILVSLLSLHKVLGFYFWHDDFSILYTARTGECVFGWPYSSYCTLFPFLDKFFNYNPFLYFLLGIVLAIATFIAFYLFCLNFFPKRVAILITLLFSTVSMGGGALFEVYSIITTFASLLTLLIALNLFVKFKKIFLGFVFLALSVVILEARSASYAIPIVAAIFLFKNKLNTFRKILLSILVVIVHASFYMAGYFSKIGTAVQAPVNNYAWVLSIDPIRKISNFFQNIALSIMNDSFYNKFHLIIKEKNMDSLYFLVGILIISIYFYSIYRQKDVSLRNQKIFFGILTLALYLPYGISSDYRLDSSHRYLIFMLPGLLLMLATFYEQKAWKYIVAILIIIGIFQTNILFEKNLVRSKNRSSFFAQLHKITPKLEKGTVLYFEFPKEVRGEADDFFRVGHEPPEASIGTEFKIVHNDIKILTTKEELESWFKANPKAKDNIHSYSYDGVEVKETNLF